MSEPAAHEFDQLGHVCARCGMHQLAVLGNAALSVCTPPAPTRSLNHGGPGICRICYPRKSNEQGELKL